MVHRPLRLLRRRRQLLLNLLVSVHHFRPDRGDCGPWHDLLRGERSALHVDRGADGMPMPLLVRVPLEASRALRPAGVALQRLSRPLLLRDLRSMSGIPGATEPRFRRGLRMARQHGKDARWRDDPPTACSRSHDALIWHPKH